MGTSTSERKYEPRFISCYELTPCQNKDCDIRSTGLWKMKDGRCVCHSCKINGLKANDNGKD